MNAIDYFESKIQCTISPMDYMLQSQKNDSKFILVDVRNAPAHIKKNKIKGAIDIAQTDIEHSLTSIPKDKTIVVYCWDTFCNLGAKSAITLLNNGYDVIELSGGIAAWHTLNLETEQF
jgi:rhodanese-related sulfurtransferase